MGAAVGAHCAGPEEAPADPPEDPIATPQEGAIGKPVAPGPQPSADDAPSSSKGKEEFMDLADQIALLAPKSEEPSKSPPVEQSNNIAAETKAASNTKEATPDPSPTATADGTEGSAHVKAPAESKPQGKARARARAEAIFVFETPGGEQKTVSLHYKPPGFSIGIPSMKTSNVTGSEAKKAGIKEGWILQQWGNKADSMESVEDGDQPQDIGKKFMNVVEVLPPPPAPKKKAAPKEKPPPEDPGSASDVSVEPLTPLNPMSPRFAALNETYEESAKRFYYDLNVTIVSARGLRDADWAPGGGSSDPFCVCEHHAELGKEKAKFQTRTIDNQNNPVWRHEEILKNFHYGDKLKFHVYDKDIVGAESLGWAELGTDKIVREGKNIFMGELKLKDAGIKNAYVKLKVEVLKRHLSLNYHKDDVYRLDLNIVSAEGLRDADWLPGGGGSDPYCKVSVIGKGSSTFKTRTIKNQNNPAWREIGLLTDFVKGDKLLFEVYDYDFGKSDDLLGKVEVHSNDILAKSGFAGALKLKETGKVKGKPVDATLRVSVQAHKRDTNAKAPMQTDETAKGNDTSKTAFELAVTLCSADGLRVADYGSKSDPYAVCEVKGKGKSHFKTKTNWNTQNPVWHETGTIKDFHYGDILHFYVKDKDFFTADDPLGRVELCTGQIIPGGYEGDLQLIDTGASTEAGNSYISVKIKVVKRYTVS
eukprot:TRINITY_DN90966_c0_g1_i1.p1 TRINITY_DN90966_c0_g1~~TRINITY_DN90966_c0_g1_i1.p1  ORF type:complete len:705 (+),score=143.90 TRINITY_DN90966_c0_g1_i1:91-2205(+)